MKTKTKKTKEEEEEEQKDEDEDEEDEGGGGATKKKSDTEERRPGGRTCTAWLGSWSSGSSASGLVTAAGPYPTPLKAVTRTW